MPKLTPVSWQELVARLRRLGFDGPYQGGKHPYMAKGDLVLTIPNVHRAHISADLLSQILGRGGISRDEWLSAG